MLSFKCGSYFIYHFHKRIVQKELALNRKERLSWNIKHLSELATVQVHFPEI